MIESEHLIFQRKWKDHPKLIRCDVLGTILIIEYKTEATSYYHPLKQQLVDFFKSEGDSSAPSRECSLFASSLLHHL